MGGYFFTKLRNLSAEEIISRSRSRLTKVYETACHVLGIHDYANAIRVPESLKDIGIDVPWIPIEGLGPVIDIIRSRFDRYERDIKRKADGICNREFDLFGNRFCYGEKIPWNADPLSGKEWPRVFHPTSVYSIIPSPCLPY